MPLRHTRQAPPARGHVAPLHRGPQAVNQSAVTPLPFHAPNAALLIDFDNVTMGIRSDLASELKSLLSSDIVKGKVSVQRAYADWRRYPQYIVPLSESSIDLIFAPAYGSSKKNATDIRLAIDALELVFTRPEIGTFILLSGDSDFSSLVIKLKEYGKYVIGVGIRESSSDLLVQNCDEYYSYNALAGLVNTRDEEVVKWDPWELATESVQRMKRNGDVMRADRLKQVMQQIDSSFDEKNLGMSKFSRFVMEASQRGILSLHKMENGQYEVDLPKTAPVAGAEPSVETVAAENAAAETSITAAEDAAGASAAAPSVSTPAPSASSLDDRRGRGRSRRGRGRGREREERGAISATSSTTDVAETTEVTAGTEAAPEFEFVTPVAQESAKAPARAPAKAEVREPVVVASDESGIGQSGMRLTRDEAFDLVRRAVQSVAKVNAPAKASTVRTAARTLLNRDSESLSERNFTRILQDAHDADLIDLRRRGNDYEVSPAVAAAPIADQLTTAQQGAVAAAAAAQPSTPAVVAPRGMGHRGAGRGFSGRGGRKSDVLPADLLSIGVVDYSTGSNDKAPAAPISAPPVVAVEVPVVSAEPAARNGRPGRGGGRKLGRRTAEVAPAAAPVAAVAPKVAAPVVAPPVAAKQPTAKRAPAKNVSAKPPVATKAAVAKPPVATKAAPAKPVAKNAGRKRASVKK